MSLENLKRIMRSGQVRRWHTEPGLNQTVGEHSWGVAAIVLLLKPDASAELLKAAITHDWHESTFADIPSPTKLAFPGLAVAEETAIARFLASIGLEPPKLTDEEKQILYTADKLEAMLFLIGQNSAAQYSQSMIDRLEAMLVGKVSL